MYGGERKKKTLVQLAHEDIEELILSHLIHLCAVLKCLDNLALKLCTTLLARLHHHLHILHVR